MACLRSKPAWQLKIPNRNGKHEITFRSQDREPDFYVPCNRCPGCYKAKKEEWGIRMCHEAEYWERNCFITLTYDDENLPEDGKISKQVAKRFLQDLQDISSRPLRYFLAGEYGEKTRRPHYHAIIFNEDFLGGSYEFNNELYVNPIVQHIWGLGSITIADFEPATAMYTAGYCAKKANDKDTFSIMSIRPPLGKQWALDNREALLNRNSVIINGYEHKIPEPYLKWIEKEQNIDQFKQQRRKEASRFTYNDRQLKAKGLYIKHFTKEETL